MIIECVSYVYGMTVTWQFWNNGKELCSCVNLSNTNSTWTGTLGVKLGPDSDYVLCYIIPFVNIEFFLHPSQILNGCPSLLYQTPPQFQHANVVCHSPRCSYLSFPNGSTLSLTNT